MASFLTYTAYYVAAFFGVLLTIYQLNPGTPMRKRFEEIGEGNLALGFSIAASAVIAALIFTGDWHEMRLFVSGLMVTFGAGASLAMAHRDPAVRYTLALAKAMSLTATFAITLAVGLWVLNGHSAFLATEGDVARLWLLATAVAGLAAALATTDWMLTNGLEPQSWMVRRWGVFGCMIGAFLVMVTL